MVGINESFFLIARVVGDSGLSHTDENEGATRHVGSS